MSKLTLATLLLAFAGIVPHAHASTIAVPDQIETFDAAGAFHFGDTSLAGTITIDVTAGTLRAADLTVHGVTFDTNLASHSVPRLGLDVLSIGSDKAGQVLVLDLPTATLVGYDGGDLGSDPRAPFGSIAGVVCFGNGTHAVKGFDLLDSGSLSLVTTVTRAVASVPLPRTLTGLAVTLAVLAVARSRRGWQLD